MWGGITLLSFISLIVTLNIFSYTFWPICMFSSCLILYRFVTSSLSPFMYSNLRTLESAAFISPTLMGPQKVVDKLSWCKTYFNFPAKRFVWITYSLKSVIPLRSFFRVFFILKFALLLWDYLLLSASSPRPSPSGFIRHLFIPSESYPKFFVDVI